MYKSFIFLLTLTCVSGFATAQTISVDVPSGYKVVVVPSSVNVPEAISMTSTTPQATYTTTQAPAPIYHPRARHIASVAEGMVIEHQMDDHH